MNRNERKIKISELSYKAFFQTFGKEIFSCFLRKILRGISLSSYGIKELEGHRAVVEGTICC